MDKLDIFKLLTSAYNFYQNKNKKENEKNSSENFLKKILNPQNNTDINTEKNEEFKETKLIPLQEKMLSTMRSHNEFVSRVMQNNKKDGK